MKWKSSPSRYRNWTGRFSSWARGHFVAGLEAALDGLAALDVAQLDPDLGRAAAHLDVVVVEDLPELAVELDGDALAQVAGGDHGRWAPEAGRPAARTPRGWPVPGRSGDCSRGPLPRLASRPSVPRATASADDDDLAREVGQPLDPAGRRRRRPRGPRCGRRSRPRGRRRARPRTPSATAAARRPRAGRATAARASPGRSRDPGRGRTASPWPAASMTSRASASAARPEIGRPAVRRPPRRRRSTAACGAARRARRSPGRAASARPRTASGSCRSGSPRPARRSRTAAPPGRGSAGRRASRAAAPPPGPARHATSKASASAPPVRISHSRSQGELALRPPGRIAGSEPASARSRDRAGRRDPLELGRLLDRPVASTQPSTGDQLDVRRRRREPVPGRLADEARLDGRRAAPRASRRAPASAPARSPYTSSMRVAGRLARRLDRVAAVGDRTHVLAADEELARDAGDLLLAVVEREARQVADVLGPDAEVGVEPARRRTAPAAGPGAPAGPPGRPRPSALDRPPWAGARSRRGMDRGAQVTCVAVLLDVLLVLGLGLGERGRVRAVVLGHEEEVAGLRVRRRAPRRSRRGRGADRPGQAGPCSSTSRSPGGPAGIGTPSSLPFDRRPERVVRPTRRSAGLRQLERVVDVEDVGSDWNSPSGNSFGFSRFWKTPAMSGRSASRIASRSTSEARVRTW